MMSTTSGALATKASAMPSAAPETADETTRSASAAWLDQGLTSSCTPNWSLRVLSASALPGTGHNGHQLRAELACGDQRRPRGCSSAGMVTFGGGAAGHLSHGPNQAAHVGVVDPSFAAIQDQRVASARPAWPAGPPDPAPRPRP